MSTPTIPESVPQTPTQEQIEAMQAADGIQVNEPIQEDYFGFSERHKWFFPDKVSFIEFQVMNEGDRTAFQRATNRDLKLNRNTQDVQVKTDIAGERQELLKKSVKGWNLKKDNQLIPFTDNNFNNWLQVANPKFVNDLEQTIRLANPWMQDDMTIEQINEERKRLDDLEEAIKAREAEKLSSFDK